MTINSSVGCSAAPATLAPTDSASVGTPGPDAETPDSSPFSMMLTGMTETPQAATEPQAPASTDEVEDAVILDPALSPAVVAAQAIIAALVPVIAPPAAAIQAKQALPAESQPVVSPAAVQQTQVAALDSAGLSAAWLVAVGRNVDSDVAPEDMAGDGESLEHLAFGAQSGGTATPASPATGFSPLMQASQLGNAFSQGTTNVLQPQPPLQHSVGTARWAEELGTRLTLMASQGQMSGSLTLSPEHLGPLHVQIDIKNDVASVWFGSQHADTRAALNDALPRLREMFGASGLVLGDTGVSRDTPRQEAHAAEARRFATQREESVLGSSERRIVKMAHAGILDTYA